MVTWNECKWDGVSRLPNQLAREYKEGTCLSSDTKPIDVANGSRLIEADTSTVYIFDQQNNLWRRFT